MLYMIYGFIVEHATFIGIFLDFMSLIATILLTIAIYRLERRHEKSREELDISKAAHAFLTDNDNEVEYLFLAEIAGKLNRKKKHVRNLITCYMRCDEKLRREILRQANIPDINVSDIGVKNALNQLQMDLDRFNFGKNILYDGAKYLHRALEKWSTTKIEDINPYVFENLKRNGELENAWLFKPCNSTLVSYMINYLRSEELGIDRQEIQPPIDMVYQKCNLGFCEESIVTFWVMRIIIDACFAFKGEEIESTFDEYLIQTQEDMYYYTLAVLCQAYSTGEKNE